eukprot:1671617-Rhodomonas_salina.2
MHVVAASVDTREDGGPAIANSEPSIGSDRIHGYLPPKFRRVLCKDVMLLPNTVELERVFRVGIPCSLHICNITPSSGKEHLGFPRFQGECQAQTR